MTFPFLKKAGIRRHNAAPSATWSSAGRGYDEISRGISDAIEHCVERLAPRDREHILDVACGTGWTARRLAEHNVTVTGSDFAPDMLATARQIADARNLKIKFEEGDAEALPYKDGAFDAVISTFGVMFALHPEDAARELARVCRKGGRLALALWTPDGNVFEMFKVMKAFMTAPDGTPPPSPFAWGDPDRVRELLGEDFDLAFERGTSFYREPSGLAAWETFSTGYGPLYVLASKLERKKRDELKEAFIAFHDAFWKDLGVTVPRDYLIVTGTRR